MTDLKSLIRTILDYPKPGIQFRDITTLLRDPIGLRVAVDRISNRYANTSVDPVAGIEARGFIFGSDIFYRLELGFVPIRKPGKLPAETIGRDFDLEYGSDRVEMHVGAIEPGRYGDLIAVTGDPLAEITILQDIEVVIKGGRRYK